MSLMGTTKHQISSHGQEARAPGIDECDLLSPDANDPDLPSAQSFRSPNSSASNRAPKRIKRHQDSRTATTHTTEIPKPITTPKEHRRSTTRVGRVPLADLGSTLAPGLSTPKNSKHREHHVAKFDRVGQVPTENDGAPHLDSDEESFGGGDMFTSTDQQQLSAPRIKLPRQGYDETTREF